MSENIYGRKKNKTLQIIIIVILALLLLLGTFWFFQQRRVWANEKDADKQKISELQNTIIKQKSDLDKQKNDITALNQEIDKLKQVNNTEYILVKSNEIVTAIKNKDMEKLATFVDPEKGVRFSPYAYVDTTKDITFKQDQVKDLFNDTNKYSWGFYDGSGDPIKLTFDKYYNDFVYDKDYINAVTIANNYRAGNGNSINNIVQAYPNATFVEYHFPGVDTNSNGMDWKSIRLVFEMKNNIWYLVGIVHDQWTI